MAHKFHIPLSLKAIADFVHLESASGVVLFSAAVLALILANSGLQSFYFQLTSAVFAFKLNGATYSSSVQSFVNDGLMTIFFLIVGLEVKREVFEGELNSLAKIILPGIAALGGMIVPALFFFVMNGHHSVYIQGWAIPTATDIAFALGVLLLLGKRIPISLKVFLTALAIFDDIGAILIISCFYSVHISGIALAIAVVCFATLIILNYQKISFLPVYLILGFFLWLSVLYSGIHPTIAGVLLALTIPISSHSKRSLVHKLENYLHPWVAFLILPLFGFINSGISLAGITTTTLFSSLTLGILLGLFIGKQLGVFGAAWLAIKLKWTKLPQGGSFPLLYGVSILCGIGFTMSLFIGALAFKYQNDPNLIIEVKLGVLLASLFSGLLGYLVLRFQSPKAKQPIRNKKRVL
jgi:NhaA family Na+:H+ antiporter